MRLAAPRRLGLSITAHAFAVLLGLSAPFVVHLVGDLPVAEVLVTVVIAPVLILYWKRIFRRDAIPIYILMAVWLAGQILTDIYRSTPTLDWLRGDAAIFFFVMDMALAVALMSGNRLRQVLFFTGFGVGSLLAFKLQPNALAEGQTWKFGLSGGVNLLVVLVSCLFFNRRQYSVTLLLLGGIGAVNLLLNYRSPVLLLLVTIALAVPIIPEQIGPWQILPPPGTRMRLVVLVSLALGAGMLASGLVKGLSSRGFLGDDAQHKNEAQSHVKGGILLGGRPEIQVSSRAVLDSPILGHGSWAKDFKYTEMLNDLEIENGAGLEGDLDYLEEQSKGVIPSHSHLMGAWVWAGIAGAIFWIYIFLLIGKATIYLAMQRPAYSPLVMFLFMGMLWDILFSPFGTSRRLLESVLVVMALDLVMDQMRAFPSAGRHPFRRWKRQLPRRPAPVVSAVG
jgi:hypothetical protein